MDQEVEPSFEDQGFQGQYNDFNEPSVEQGEFNQDQYKDDENQNQNKMNLNKSRKNNIQENSNLDFLNPNSNVFTNEEKENLKTLSLRKQSEDVKDLLRKKKN